jgi:hypothetical protein
LATNHLVKCVLQDFCKGSLDEATTNPHGGIDKDQIAFLPFRFNLDNILLMIEIIDWAWHINQPLVMFKLNFTKVNDKVKWSFLFGAMEKMGMVQ